jgi:adenylate cyclase
VAIYNVLQGSIGGPLHMSEQAPRRRLAAILAADVVGYSRMMQADEAGTLAALKSRRTDILQPLVTKHHGRVVKMMGDGVLIEYASAVDAVACAAELQDAMAAANTSLPENRYVVLRIGINLGDVMVEGGDLYGDGVNVAARLEAMAEAGSIFVSQAVFSHVRGKVQVSFEDLGPQEHGRAGASLQSFGLRCGEITGCSGQALPAGKIFYCRITFHQYEW